MAEGIWLLIVVALPAAANPWGALAFGPTKAGLLRALAVLMLAAWMAGRLAGTGRVGVSNAPLIRAGALYLTALSLSSAFSTQPLLSVFGIYERGTGLLTTAAGFCMVLVGVDLFSEPRRRERAVVALVLGGALPSVYALLQYLGLDPFNWTGARGILSTLGSPAPLAGFLALVTPLAFYVTAAGGQALLGPAPTGATAVARYVGALTVALLAPLVIILASTRGPFLGLVAGLAAQGLALASGSRSPAPWFRRPRRAFVVAFLLVSVLLGGVAVGVARDVPLASRFADIASPVGSGEGRGTAAERLIVWGETVRLLATDPPRMLVGFGPETQAGVLEQSEASVRLGQRDRWDRAHNLLLDAWITSGLVGVGSLLVLTWVALRGAWRCATEASSGMRERALAAALLGAMIAHLVDASFSFQGATTGTIFWAVLGLVASLRPGAPPAPTCANQAPRHRLAWAVAIVAVGVLLASVAGTPALADALQGAAGRAGRRGQHEASATLADRAAMAAFWAEAPMRDAALALHARATVARNPERAKELFSAAEERFREAAARDAYNPFAHLRLVRHYLARSERAVNDEDRRRLLELAARSCHHGIRTGPFRTDIRVTCTDVSQKLGRPGE